MIAQHKPTFFGAAIGSALVTLAILARTAWGATAPPEPSTLDKAIAFATLPATVMLAGVLTIGVGQLFAVLRRRWGRIRRGWLGALSSAAVSACSATGAAWALTGSATAGVAALAGVTVTAAGLARDPATAKLPAEFDESEMVP